MERLSLLCQHALLKGGISETRQRIERLAGHLAVPYAAALAAVDLLEIGLASAALVPDRNSWEIEKDGTPVITLPVSDWPDVIDLLAIDFAAPDMIYQYRQNGPPAAALNDTALFDAHAVGEVFLFETPSAWLKGWCAHWMARQALAAHAAPPSETTTPSPHFPGVCLLDPAPPLLPRLGGVAKITCADLDHGQRIAAKLKAEIAAAEAARRYPAVAVQSQIRKVA